MSDELIDRAPGDDLVVPLLMRRSSLEALTARPDARSVPVGNGHIGLVPGRAANGEAVWVLVVWSPDSVFPEAIPANQDSVDAQRKEAKRAGA